MASFNIRVELKGTPAGEDYEKLHTAMMRAGFSRIIIDDDGVRYHLPPAEYVGSGDWNASVVQKQVWLIATSVWKQPAVYVTTAGSRSWRGLKEVG
jgi:hypothetical protein